VELKEKHKDETAAFNKKKALLKNLLSKKSEKADDQSISVML